MLCILTIYMYNGNRIFVFIHYALLMALQDIDLSSQRSLLLLMRQLIMAHSCKYYEGSAKNKGTVRNIFNNLP